MNSAVFAVAAVAAVILTFKTDRDDMQEETAQYLMPSDFMRGGRDWLPVADPALVNGLNLFFGEIRRQGGEVFISRNKHALGRTQGSRTSQHFTEPGRPFRAADVVVIGIDHRRAYQIARDLRVFSGIGAYNGWQQGKGLHLDTRTDRSPENPATWAGLMIDDGAGNLVQSTNFGIEQAFA